MNETIVIALKVQHNTAFSEFEIKAALSRLFVSLKQIKDNPNKQINVENQIVLSHIDIDVV